MVALAEDEIGAQMASLREEMSIAINDIAPAPQMVVPAGMTRAEFKEWKMEQVQRAKSRLTDLEERLKRLQLLEDKMQRLKTSSDSAVDAVPDHWTLPGSVDDGKSYADEFGRPQARASPNLNPSGESYYDMQLQQNSSSSLEPYEVAGKPKYRRPISPSVIRQIIREELAVAANESGITDFNPVNSLDSEKKPGSTGSRRVGLASDLNHSIEEKIGSRGSHKEEADATDQKHDDEDQTMRRKRQQDLNDFDCEPNTLEETTPISCPWLFGGLSHRHPIRQQCFAIRKSMVWQTFFLGVVVANNLYITLAPEYSKSTDENGYRVITTAEWWFDFVCVLIMGFEVTCGIFAYGMFKGNFTYLRCSVFNRLDFVCFLLTVLEYAGAYFDYPSLLSRSFRMLRIFRPMCAIKALEGVKSIIATLSKGASQLGTVFAMLVLTILCFAIIGMTVYRKSFRRRCVTLDLHPAVGEGVVMFAASFPFETWCDVVGFEAEYDKENRKWIAPDPSDKKKFELFERYQKEDKLKRPGYYDRDIDPYPKDPYGRWHTCQRNLFLQLPNEKVTSMCEDVGNPSGGFSHFDNVWGSVCSLAQAVVPDSYYNILLRTQQSEPYIVPASMTFFVFFNLMTTFLLLGIFVSVVTGTFKRVREQNQGQSSMITVDQQKDLQFEAIMNELMQREDAKLSSEEAIQRTAMYVVQSSRFKNLTTSLILIMLCTMALDTHDAFESLKRFNSYGSVVVTFFFLFELVLNFVAAGSLQKFWSRGEDRLFHRFESFLVLMGILSLVTGVKELALIPALRTYRLMKYFPTLEEMLKSAVASAQAVLNVVLFFLTVMLCFVVAARYMFGTRVDKIARQNFSNLLQASLVMFQMLTTDSWSDVMWSTMIAFPIDEKTSPTRAYMSQFFGCLLIMTWFFFACLIARNLFIAVVIENFSIAQTMASIRKPGKLHNIRFWVTDTFRNLVSKADAIADGSVILHAGTGVITPVQATRHHLSKIYTEDVMSEDHFGTLEKVVEKRGGISRGFESSSKILQIVSSVARCTRPMQKADEGEDHPERVLMFLLPNNPVRVLFVWLAGQPAFDALCLACILVSCFFLLITPAYKDMVLYPGQEDLEPPLVPIPFEIMDIVDKVITVVFTFEFFSKVMAQGLLFTQNAYLKSGWNVVDTAVVSFSWIEFFLNDAGQYKVLRLGRCLKPLRLIKRNPKMRVVVDALICSLQPLAYVLLFLFFTVFIFAMIGQGLFGSKLYFCNNPNVAFPMGKADCSNTWVRDFGNDGSLFSGVLYPSAWVKPYHFSFDTYSESVLTLCFVSSLKYVGILYACMDITNHDLQPSVNYRTEHFIFFVVYICLGSLFVMNLFVAYIIDGFHGYQSVMEVEKIYKSFLTKISATKPKYDVYAPPKNGLSTALRKIIESPVFQTMSIACVITNVFFLLADNADSAVGTYHRFIIDTQNLVFFLELCCEVALNIVAFGIGGFYDDLAKSFDLIACAAQVIGLVVGSQMLERIGRVTRLCRAAIVGRQKFKVARKILDTLAFTLPQLWNIVLLLFIFYSMFAIAGVTFFSTTKFGQRYGYTASFQSYGSAFATIYQIATGDEWMILITDLGVQPPFCDMHFTKATVYGYTGPDRTWGDCGQSMTFSSFFFLAVKLMCEYVLLNLFIGLIIDNFGFITEDVAHQEDGEWETGPSEEQLMKCCRVFQMFDKGTGFFPISSLHFLLRNLPVPLGYLRPDGKLRMKRKDLMLELLVRSELNLALRHDREAADENNSHWWVRVGLKKPARSKIFVHGISYDVLIRTLWYWRMPTLVPDMVKWQRRDRVEECALVAHALICVEFFRMLVGRRKRKKMGVVLAKRSRFVLWGDSDPHRKRRNLHTLNERMQQREIALKQKVPLLYYLNEPIDSQLIVLDWLLVDDFPEDFLEHAKAVRKYNPSRVPQPIAGIEVFRQMASRMAVAMQLVDPNNKDLIGDLVVADFTRVQWREWHPVNTKAETYFEPLTFMGFDKTGKVNPSVGWDRVDLYIQEKSLKDKPSARKRQRRLGSIEEFQSYVVEDPTRSEKGAADRVRSHVRVNLGNHQYNSDKLKIHKQVFEAKRNLGDLKHLASLHGSNVMRAFSAKGSNLASSRSGTNTGHSSGKKSEDDDGTDAVLEVVGYLPILRHDAVLDTDPNTQASAHLPSNVKVGRIQSTHARTNPTTHAH